MRVHTVALFAFPALLAFGARPEVRGCGKAFDVNPSFLIALSVRAPPAVSTNARAKAALRIGFISFVLQTRVACLESLPFS